MLPLNAALSFMILFTGTAFADLISNDSSLAGADPSENAAYFGDQGQLSITGHRCAICAAAAAINSFIFLENQYPQVYGNRLTPNVSGLLGDQTDPADTASFAIQYYFGLDLNPALNPLTYYMYVKSQWINSYAPGTTVFDSWYITSPYNNRLPNAADLFSQIANQEDVEFFVSGVPTGYTKPIYHALDLTGISCTGPGYTNCSITYQDPNTPSTNQQAALTSTSAGLQFQNLPLSGYKGTFTVYAAFSESPVPEPASIILLATGLGGLTLSRVWKRAG